MLTPQLSFHLEKQIGWSITSNNAFTRSERIRQCAWRVSVAILGACPVAAQKRVGSQLVCRWVRGRTRCSTDSPYDPN